MSIFYTVFIYPIELFLSFVFSTLVGIVNNYGIALILLSIIVNIILIPLYHLADTWRKKEKAHHALMKGDIEAIKNNYSGQEKYYSLKTAYRIYHYKPLMSLRVSAGFLIQIPFFFAAYHFLSYYQAYQGIGFLGIIPDLSKADGLLWGINILPFIMIVVNILAGLVYSTPTKKKKITKDDQKEFSQLLILSLVFLILLYNSPSALLIYWTMNNIFSLIKYYIIARPKASQVLRFCRKNLTDIITHRYMGYAMIFTVMYIINFDIIYITHEWRNSILSIFAIEHALFLSFIIVVYMWAYVFALTPMTSTPITSTPNNKIFSLRKKSSLLNITSIGIACIACITSVILIYSNTHSGQNLFHGAGLFELTPNRLRQISIFLLSTSILLFLPTFLPLWKIRSAIKTQFSHIISIETNAKTRANTRRVSIRQGTSVAGFIVFMFFFIVPLQIYITEPLKFSHSGLYFLMNIMLFCVIAFFITYLIIRYISKYPKIMYLFIVFLLWIAVIGIWNGFMLDLKLGELITRKFTNEEILMQIKSTTIYLELLFYLGILLVIYLYKKIILKYTVIAMLLFAVFAGYQATQIIFKNRALFAYLAPKKEMQDNALPPYHNRFASFSKEKNILFILLDQFPANFLEDIMQDDPNIKQGLQGFTWYKNTVSTYRNTRGSMPSIIGGHQYVFEKLPSFKTKNFNDNYDKVLEAYSHWSETLKDYEITYWNPAAGVGVTDYKLYDDLNKNYSHNTLAIPSEPSYYPYWYQQEKLKNPDFQDYNNVGYFLRKPITALALFRLLPYQYKQKLYLDKSWNAFIENHINQYIGVKQHFMTDETLLDTMPTTSTADSKKKTFKIYWGETPHAPHYLDSACYLAVDEIKSSKYEFISRENQVQQLTCSLERLFKWFDWMKEAGIYDNTKIVIASDHGSTDYKWIDKHGDLSKLLSSGGLFALLLVKDFNQQGAFSVDKRMMSNADIPSILASGMASGMDEYDFSHLISDPTKIDYALLDTSEKRNMIYWWREDSPIEILGDDIYDQDNWNIINLKN